MSTSVRSSPLPGRGATAPTSDIRRQVAERPWQTWIKKLIDLSKRDNLLHYRPLKTSTHDLSNADGEKTAARLSGKRVTVSKLLPEARDESSSNILRDIARNALANAEEKNCTLYSWLWAWLLGRHRMGADPQKPPLLLPVTLEARGHGTQSLRLARTNAFLFSPYCR